MSSKINDTTTLWNKKIIISSLCDAFIKLNFKNQSRNPVMFTVYIGAILVSIIWLYTLKYNNQVDSNFIGQLVIWLWFTVLFSNFAEAMAEGRGKAQANTLRKSRRDVVAKKLSEPNKQASITLVKSSDLKSNDFVLVESGDFIPSDGEVIEGVAFVNESAITGESAPVIRESGGDRSAVTGGTQVISDWILIRITADPGNTFLDNMISLVEGAKRQKTPNEIALTAILASLTLIFLLVCTTLLPFSLYAANYQMNHTVSIPILIALFVCLAPTTIGGLLSAIGIAGMDRMIQKNIIALSGHAIEAAGDVNVLLLDKTGTITLGNRQATEFIPVDNVNIKELAEAALLASLADETAEGRSIVALAHEKYAIPHIEIKQFNPVFIKFTAQTRMSGVDFNDTKIRKGALDAIEALAKDLKISFPEQIRNVVFNISIKGATPLVVINSHKVLGVICLKDIIKGQIRERFSQLRQMGIKTIMITGDNPLTAATIAAEAGVDDFLAEAKPEDKMVLIKKLQQQGFIIAMTGDGTNDAPALAQADVAVAMNSGTQAAKEASNLIDLDSNPTKLLDVVEVGKQLLMTRGSITTFSIANDIAKYFAILPAAFADTYPLLNKLNIMHLHSPKSAILSTVIFNACIIIFLIPLALRGINYKNVSTLHLLYTNILFYGLGGVMIPFLGIKLIDMLITFI